MHMKIWSLSSLIILSFASNAAQARDLLPAVTAMAACRMAQGSTLAPEKRINRRTMTYYQLCTSHHTGEATNPLGPHLLYGSTSRCCTALSVGARREYVVNVCGPKGWPGPLQRKVASHGGAPNDEDVKEYKLHPPSEVFKCIKDAGDLCANKAARARNPQVCIKAHENN